MSKSRIYIKSGWDEVTAYDSRLEELLSSDKNHIEEHLDSLKEKVGALIELLVEKDIISMDEVVSALGYDKSRVITSPVDEYGFEISNQHRKDRKLDIVNIIHKTSTDFNEDNRPYSIKITPAIIDTGTRYEMYEKYSHILPQLKRGWK